MEFTTASKNMFQTLGNNCLDSDNEFTLIVSGMSELQVETATEVSIEVSSSSQSNSIEKERTVRPTVPFDGRAVAPLVRRDQEFPSLKSAPASTRQERVITSSYEMKKPKVTSFIVASSYNETRWSKPAQKVPYANADSERTSAFSLMENKEAVAKTLTCTRACNNVSRRDDGNYGVCCREKCSFAHSLAELTDPKCGFDKTCRLLHGRKRPDGSIDAAGRCMFRHSHENHDNWIKRTGRTNPDLPETSEETRKPFDPTSVKKVEIEQQVTVEVTEADCTEADVTETELVEVEIDQVDTDSVEFNEPTQPVIASVDTTRVRRKSRWDEKPSNISEPETFVIHQPIESLVSTEPSEKSHSRSSKSPSKYESRHRKHDHKSTKSSSKSSKSSSNHRESNQAGDVQVIRVPTHELAEIAIKAAFDRGVYNLQVIVA
jgi:hypothetical protein